MDKRREKNIRQIAQARFQNPRFVYDGKRAQPVYDRMSYDSTSANIYRMQVRRTPMVMNMDWNLESQILNMPPPDEASAHDALTPRFLHMCINKVRSCVNAIAWSPDGRRLLSGSSSGEITMWSGSSFNFETILQAHESPLRTMAWAPSSTFLLTGDNQGLIKYWNRSMNNIQQINAHLDQVKDVCFSPTDEKFVSASDDGTVRIWDSFSCTCEQILRGHNWDVRNARWHPSLALIASGGKDNIVQMWDPRLKGPVGTFHYHKNTIMCMQWFKDNYLLTGGKDQVVKKFDLRMQHEPMVYKPLNRDITSLAGHPHANSFVVGLCDGDLAFWEADTFEPIHTRVGAHEGIIWGLEYHPVGHVLATGGSDCMGKFWGRRRPIDIVTAERPQEEDEKIDMSNIPIPGLFNI